MCNKLSEVFMGGVTRGPGGFRPPLPPLKISLNFQISRNGVEKKGISIKDYFNAPFCITQPTAEPSNESDGNTSTSLPNETTNDKQQPPLSENQRYHPDSSYVFPETVFGKQTRLVQAISMARLQHFRRF